MTSNESLFFLYTIIWEEIIERIQFVDYKMFWFFFKLIVKPKGSDSIHSQNISYFLSWYC